MRIPTPFTIFAWLVIALACAALWGCGGKLDTGADSLAAGPVPAADLAGLPAPSEVLRRLPSNLADSDTFKRGASYAATLPFQNVAASGTRLVYSPNWGPYGTKTFSNLAFALYTFKLGDDAGNDIYFGWGAGGEGDAGSCWLGLGNYAKDRWEWHNIQNTYQLTVPGLASPTYRNNTDGGMVAVLLFTGTAPWDLDWLAAGGLPIEAVITADVSHGPQGQVVNFDATGSDSANGIEKYEWDVNGDGTFDTDTGATPTTSFTYDVGGIYQAGVRVTGPGGLVDTTAMNIYIYSETEPNNEARDADALPANSFESWCGSIGTGDGYPGYDGSTVDYCSFVVPAASSFVLRVMSDPTCDIALEMRDFVGTKLATLDTPGLGVTETLAYTGKSSDVRPYIIQVKSAAGYGDYVMDAKPGAPPHVNLSASPLLGPANLEVNFDASDSGDPDGAIVGYAWDWDNDGTYDDTTAEALTTHIFTAPGLYTITVQVTDNDGFSANDTVAIHVTNASYDEVEDNDTRATANALPIADFTGWRGSIGTGTGYDGYDGDLEDYTGFTAELDSVFTATLSYASSTAVVDLALIDSDGDTLKLSAGLLGLITMSYRFAAGDTAPFYLRVRALSGYSSYLLSKHAGANPDASLTAAPLTGPAPLTVQFDGSASSDLDAPLAKFEWDWDGDGVFDLDSATDPTVSHIYTQDGLYRCYLRVTDSDGNTDLASALIIVGANGYDEVENNDNSLMANLVTFPVEYSGSLGMAFGYPGYDGDGEDWASIKADPGNHVQLQLAMDATGDFDAALIDGHGAVLDESSTRGLGVAETLDYTFLPGDLGPYCIRITSYDGHGDYLLTGTKS